MIKYLPFVPIPVEKALRISKKFKPFSKILIRIYPALETSLEQIEFGIDAIDYISISLFGSIFIGGISFLSIFLISLILKKISIQSFLISLLIGVIIGVVAHLYLVFYPRLKLKKKESEIERNLHYALRHLLIKIRSGIPLYNAMVGIAKGDYGIISKEFDKAIDEMNSGISETAALENMAMRNPSTYFRRIIWQISNSMRAGAEIGDVIQVVLENFTNEQRIKVRNYGASLNPMALLYMMFSIIVPSLGMTFLLIVSSFLGITISREVYFFILFTLGLFQFMFMGFIKSRRPAIGD